MCYLLCVVASWLVGTPQLSLHPRIHAPSESHVCQKRSWSVLHKPLLVDSVELKGMTCPLYLGHTHAQNCKPQVPTVCYQACILMLSRKLRSTIVPSTNKKTFNIGFAGIIAQQTGASLCAVISFARSGLHVMLV